VNSPPFRAEGFELADWQQRAVESWVTGDGEPYRGTLEIFTGGGKTLMALTCMALAAAATEDLRFAVVVPTAALARQWIDSIVNHSNLSEADVGLLGAGGKRDLSEVRVLVCVLNTAAKQLPTMAESNQPLMLVVDECHRAGAPSFSKVLDTEATFRLGLSATPGREEWDEGGELLSFDDQVVGRRLGQIVYQFNLKDARQIGWLPTFTINHHGLGLFPEERREYDAVSRMIDDLAERLQAVGVESHRAREMSQVEGDLGDLARSYVGATARRKDLLYRAEERSRVASRLVVDSLNAGKRRVLLFHERVAEANTLYDLLTEQVDASVLALEHSQLPEGQRRAALQRFRSGDAQLLVSVRSLIEGIDVPDADVGISVASNASVRQRIQAMGRVLRRTFGDGPAKEADMHLLYVADSVDEFIYAKEDWADLTGEGNNSWWLWPLDPELPPEPQDGPPQTPRPTEDQEWERLGGAVPDEPVLWLGVLPSQEYSVNTLGTLRNASGTMLANPQGVIELIQQVRGSAGGRFWVTPKYHLVIMFLDEGGHTNPYVVGRLNEPFVALPEGSATDVDVASLQPGDPYPGPADNEGGSYQIRSKQGGRIERKLGGRTQFAIASAGHEPTLEENAQRVLRSWRKITSRGLDFSVNGLGHAWFEAASERRFLASVPEGFSWPPD
jgi:superfamily II DNA or RNA helicase